MPDKFLSIFWSMYFETEQNCVEPLVDLRLCTCIFKWPDIYHRINHCYDLWMLTFELLHINGTSTIPAAKLSIEKYNLISDRLPLCRSCLWHCEFKIFAPTMKVREFLWVFLVGVDCLKINFVILIHIIYSSFISNLLRFFLGTIFMWYVETPAAIIHKQRHAFFFLSTRMPSASL